MKQIFLVLIVFFNVSVSVTYASHVKHKSFNFTSVDTFFKIEEMLSNGKMPPEWLWVKMFETKGYQMLDNIWRFRIIKEQMLNAFYKPNSSKIDSILSLKIDEDLSNQVDLISKITLKNFIEIKHNMPELKKFRYSLNEELIYEESNQLLRNFLINPIESKMETPKIAFVFFEPDSYNQETGIVMDLNQVFMYGHEKFIRILSHEMYHAYRGNFANKKFTKLNEFTFQIDRLHNEGIADLINKPSENLEGSFLPQQVIDIYKDTYKNTPQILEKMDSMVVLYLRGKKMIWELNDCMSDYFLFGGHPNGYYMTNLIQQQGLTNELKRNFNNPIAFIKLYNTAAKARNNYVFSDEFISYLNLLEKKYFTKHRSNL